MKLHAAVLVLVGWFLPGSASILAQGVAIIPQPVELSTGKGHLTMNASSTLYTAQPEGDAAADFLRAFLKRSTGWLLPAAKAAATATLVLQINKQADASLGSEGYQLQVNAKHAVLQANTAQGLFYGVQTLLQLMPPAVESKVPQRLTAVKVPVVNIKDYPRFAWRGLMLDVARHFFTKEQVFQYLEDMARYKYNLLHLHLTDDQGWRIEIKALPKLTSVGAWNVKKTGTFGDFSAPTPEEPVDHGGFFSQQDIREIIAYASSRYIQILPEIDMPGHSLAAIAAYPELSCTPGEYRVNSGESHMDWRADGFTAKVDLNLCPAKEEVYVFIDKVITEVAALFPFEYIHMGGDECAKNFWENSDLVKGLMQREGLKDQHEVQNYFVRRVEGIIRSKGKKMIGWEEVLEGIGAEGSAIMSWQGVQKGIEASNKKVPAVMCPSTHTYLDLMQGDPAIEPPVYSTVLLSKSYSFDPVMTGADAQYILGGQANLWSEQVYNTRHLQYLMWPRGFAVAEALWSPVSVKSWERFIPRMEVHFQRFDVAEKKYATSVYEPKVKASSADKKQLEIQVETEIQGLRVHYSFDNSYPDAFYPVASGNITVPKDAALLRAQSYRDGKPAGRLLSVPISQLKQRAGM
jgi:hexosaminidase